MSEEVQIKGQTKSESTRKEPLQNMRPLCALFFHILLDMRPNRAVLCFFVFFLNVVILDWINSLRNLNHFGNYADDKDSIKLV